MTSNECNTSRDCFDIYDTPKICYEKADFSDEVFFCNCSNWYGWKGTNCDEVTGQLRFFRISHILLSLWAVFVIVACSRTLAMNFLYGSPTPKNNPVDPIIYTLFLLILSSIFYLINFVVQLPSLFNADAFIVADYNFLIQGSSEDVTTVAGQLAAYSLIYSSMFQSFAVITVMFSWYQVLQKIARFTSPNTVSAGERKFRWFRKFVFVYFSTLIILSGLNLVLATTLVVSMSSLVLLFVNYLVTRRFLRIIHQLQGDSDPRVQERMIIIRRATLFNSTCVLVIVLTLLPFYALYLNFEERLEPGSFNYILLLRTISIVSGFCSLTYTAWYANTVTNRDNMMPGENALSFLWRQWDAQYERLASVKNNSNVVLV